jgi:S-formylglutathione hydrolase FrmB
MAEATSAALVEANDMVKVVAKILKEPLSDQGPVLIKQLTEADTWLFTMHQRAAQMRANYRMKKGTSGEHVYRMAAETLEGAVDAIKSRSILGQSLLKYLTAELNANLHG